MKASKAIEILRFDLHHPRTCAESDTDEAIKLAIEALERHEHRYSTSFKGMMQTLPGETPEDE